MGHQHVLVMLDECHRDPSVGSVYALDTVVADLERQSKLTLDPIPPLATVVRVAAMQLCCRPRPHPELTVIGALQSSGHQRPLASQCQVSRYCRPSRRAYMSRLLA